MSFTHTLKTKLKSWDKQLDRCLPFSFLLILALVVLLRIPNFFEPYWYGDEAIYLTVGNGLNQGKVLYRDIMDHKTPIIYYLARVPNQLWFRILLLGWSLGIVTSFYLFAKKIIKHHYLATIATLLVALLTSLPWLEGNIPNGELFVLGFVMIGFWLLTKTSLFDYAFKQTKPTKNQEASFWHSLRLSFKQTKKEHWILTLAGFLFGLGLMTKVPALFDFAAALSLVLVGYLARINLNKPKTWIKNLPKALMYSLILSVGFILPIIISVIYFYFKGALPDYIQYGLLYNFHYAGTWHHDFGSSLTNFIFTLKGKLLFLMMLLALIIGLKNQLNKKLQFALLWAGLTLVASLLSNRPYPHYFIQLVAPFSLLFIVLIDNLLIATKKNKGTNLAGASLSLVVFGFSFWLINLLGVKTYSITDYYQKFFNLINHKTTLENYNNSFNPLVADNTKIAKLIAASGEKEIFVWGTNPMLYAYTKTTPPTRFVVLFHIEDVDAYDEVYNNLVSKPPRYIVVMKDANNMPEPFSTFISKHYLPNYQFDHFVLWRKIF